MNLRQGWGIRLVWKNRCTVTRLVERIGFPPLRQKSEMQVPFGSAQGRLSAPLRMTEKVG
jgi:hypothetical protein